MDEFYDQVEEVMNQCKSTDIIILLGDMNARVGEGRSGSTVGPFGLGRGATEDRGGLTGVKVKKL